MIPDSVTSIGDSAFAGSNQELTNVTIGNNVTSIGDYVFYWMFRLKAIYYSGTSEQWSSVPKGYGFMENTPAVVYVLGEPKTVPSSKTYVSGSAANGATGFAAEIEANNDDLGNVVWTVTSGGETRATAGMSYGGTVTGSVQIGLIVAGLHDENATAQAAYETYVEYTE